MEIFMDNHHNKINLINPFLIINLINNNPPWGNIPQCKIIIIQIKINLKIYQKIKIKIIIIIIKRVLKIILSKVIK